MVYPSRPDGPMFSGWLQMILTEVSFLSSTNRSNGALVGSADNMKTLNYSTDICKWKKCTKSFRSEIDSKSRLSTGDDAGLQKKKKRTSDESRIISL